MSHKYDYGLHSFDELREHCEYKAETGRQADYCECPVCNAIFEIQCLNAEIEKWQGIAEQFALSNPEFQAFYRYFREVFPQ